MPDKPQSAQAHPQAWQNLAPGWALLAICAFQARDLFNAWRTDVYAQYAPWLFLIWLLPLAFRAVTYWQARYRSPDVVLLFLAAGCVLVGTLGSLNVAKHLALGLVLAGQVPSHWGKLLWLGGIVAWLPATGWLFRDLPVSVFWIRVLALTLTLMLSFAWWRPSTR